MPVPDGLSPAQAQGVRNALVNGKGAITPVETTSGGFGQGREAAPRRDYEARRFGAQVPEPSIALRARTVELVRESYALHTAVFDGDGTSHQLAVRSMFFGTILPLSSVIAYELSQKLGGAIALDFSRSHFRDIQRISRAFKSFLEAGVSFASAAAFLGIDLEQGADEEQGARWFDVGDPTQDMRTHQEELNRLESLWRKETDPILKAHPGAAWVAAAQATQDRGSLPDIGGPSLKIW